MDSPPRFSRDPQVEIDSICDAFEAAWKSGQNPRIEEQLSQIEEPHRPVLLRELLLLELAYRFGPADTIPTSEFLARFPEQAALVQQVLSTVAARTIAYEMVLESDQSPRPNSNGLIARRETPLGASGQDRPSTLRIRCPHCQNLIETTPDSLAKIICNACGSHLNLINPNAETRAAAALKRLGRFDLVERLGVGAFGEVWKARDRQLDRMVAIKVPRKGSLSPVETEMFLREARAAAQLTHPGIVGIHEVGSQDDTVYIVSDLVRGLPLVDCLVDQRPTARQAAQLCAEIADALHYAHEAGVVHRDLKPANIMIDGAGKPHIMDFGLARRETADATLTVDGQLLGTPAYMSPEQAKGEAHRADRRSDVYSLGVILFELLTGELPFRGNIQMVVHQVINDDPPDPRQLNNTIPRDLETICLKCLRKGPDRRYRTADDLAADLRCWLNDQPILARPIGTWERLWRWSAKNIAPVAGFYAVAESLIHGADALSQVPQATGSRLPANSPPILAAWIPLTAFPILCGIYTLKGHRFAALAAAAWYSGWSLLNSAIALTGSQTEDATTTYGNLVAALIGLALFGRVLFVTGADSSQEGAAAKSSRNIFSITLAVVLGGPFIVIALVVYMFAVSVLLENVGVSRYWDVNYAPDEIVEGVPNGTPVGVIVSSVEPVGVTGFRLANSAGGRFGIDPSTGVVSVSDELLLNFETESTHLITVQSAGMDDGQAVDFRINIKNVAPSPPIDADAAPNVTSQ